MSELMTLNKLTILYMLDQVRFPLSNSQVTGFLLDREYTDYFTIQTALSQLGEAGFLRPETVRNTTLYHITAEGRKTLELFYKKISPTIREEIDTFFKEQGYRLRNELSTPADYYRTTDGEYAARCRILERSAPILELTLTVPTKEQADAVCAHWKDRSQEIYAQIIKELL